MLARLSRFLKTARLQDDPIGRMLFREFGGVLEAVERELIARKLLRDFLTERARARQARRED